MMKKKIYFILVLLLFFACQDAEVKTGKNYARYTKEAENFVKTMGLSKDFFILVDLSRPSGKNRLFIYDFKKKKFTGAYLTMHGSGRKRNYKKAYFSNNPKSFLSSKGKYAMHTETVRSSSYGRKLLLEGLEGSNSNARRRQIVLHPSRHVPRSEVYPKRIGVSRGCPAVSRKTFRKIARKASRSERKVLLWVIG